jgi:protease YdgD
MRDLVGWSSGSCLAWRLQTEERVGALSPLCLRRYQVLVPTIPRILVDPDMGPWRAVGKLQAASIDFRTVCTATLVGPLTVVHFLSGYTGNRYAGHDIALSVKPGHGNDPSRPRKTIGSNRALVSLERSLGSPGRSLPILSHGEPPKNGEDVMLAGYQRDHPLLLMADSQCQIVSALSM